MNPHPWMRHAETGHYAQLPDDPYWLAHGWQPVDGPPPDVDLLHDPVLQDPETPPDEAGSSASRPKKSAAAEKESDRG